MEGLYWALKDLSFPAEHLRYANCSFGVHVYENYPFGGLRIWKVWRQYMVVVFLKDRKFPGHILPIICNAQQSVMDSISRRGPGFNNSSQTYRMFSRVLLQPHQVHAGMVPERGDPEKTDFGVPIRTGVRYLETHNSQPFWWSGPLSVTLH